MTCNPNEASNKQVEQLTYVAGVVRRATVQEIDELADKLVYTYDNPGWRQWYCGAIHKHGIEQIVEWYNKSLTARKPANYFTFLLNNARKHGSRDAPLNNIADPIVLKTNAEEPVNEREPSGAEVNTLVSNNIDEYFRTRLNDDD